MAPALPLARPHAALSKVQEKALPFLLAVAQGQVAALVVETASEWAAGWVRE